MKLNLKKLRFLGLVEFGDSENPGRSLVLTKLGELFVKILGGGENDG